MTSKFSMQIIMFYMNTEQLTERFTWHMMETLSNTSLVEKIFSNSESQLNYDITHNKHIVLSNYFYYPVY
ncbi:hypothetical protein C0J52_13734 [Blattella germanica]|nr:hypothetical protein C0J52_13734 [Blattella germanica]